MIAQRLKQSPRRAWSALLVGAALVGADLVLVSSRQRFVDQDNIRGTLAVFGLAAMTWFCDGDLASLGLTIRPLQGWTVWFHWGFRMGIAVAACITIGLAAIVALHAFPTIYTTPPSQVPMRFLPMCVIAPVLEETVYRLVLCLPITAVSGPRTAIVLSGMAFGGLHVLYGNLSPENFVGGYFLAWAYLKSGSLLMPVVLHSLGNLAVLTAQVVGWCWFG